MIPRKLRALLAVPCLMALASGCQHVPPEPLDFGAIDADFRTRELSITPVQAYAAALHAANGVYATPFDPSDGLSLYEGQSLALWYNPSLRIARIEAAGAGNIATRGARWPVPELGVDLGRRRVEDTEITGVDPDTGDVREAPVVDRSWISVSSLSITIPLSGRVQAERQYLATQEEIALLRVAEAEWDTVVETGLAWAAWSAACERLALYDEYLALLQRFTHTATAMAEVGELPPSSARLFQIERARLEAEQVRARAAERERHAEVLALLGLLPDAPVRLLPWLGGGHVDEAQVPPPLDHPRLARLRAEYQAAEDRLRLELRRQYPDLTLSPTYTDEGDETALTLGLGFPVPVWNANTRGIAEAAAERDIARAHVEAGYQQLIGERDQAAAAATGTRAMLQRLRDDVAPVVDAQTVEALALLEIGEIEVVLLFETLTQAFAVKQELVESSLAQAQAWFRYVAATRTGPVAGPLSTEITHE